jgi:hypothetical protein
MGSFAFGATTPGFRVLCLNPSASIRGKTKSGNTFYTKIAKVAKLCSVLNDKESSLKLRLRVLCDLGVKISCQAGQISESALRE